MAGLYDAALDLALWPDARFLIIYSGTVKRKVRHVARLHGHDLWLPICNNHYLASHDLYPRQVRAPRGSEAEYPVCKRCLAWYKPEMILSVRLPDHEEVRGIPEGGGPGEVERVPAGEPTVPRRPVLATPLEG